MGEEAVSKQRITTQLKSAVKALQAAHVRDRSSVIHRSVYTKDISVVTATEYLDSFGLTTQSVLYNCIILSLPVLTRYF